MNPTQEKAKYLFQMKTTFIERRDSLVNNGSVPLAIPQGDIKTSKQVKTEWATDSLLLGEVLCGSDGVIPLARLACDKENVKRIKNAAKRRSIICSVDNKSK